MGESGREGKSGNMDMGIGNTEGKGKGRIYGWIWGIMEERKMLGERNSGIQSRKHQEEHTTQKEDLHTGGEQPSITKKEQVKEEGYVMGEIGGNAEGGRGKWEERTMQKQENQQDDNPPGEGDGKNQRGSAKIGKETDQKGKSKDEKEIRRQDKHRSPRNYGRGREIGDPGQEEKYLHPGRDGIRSGWNVENEEGEGSRGNGGEILGGKGMEEWEGRKEGNKEEICGNWKRGGGGEVRKLEGRDVGIRGNGNWKEEVKGKRENGAGNGRKWGGGEPGEKWEEGNGFGGETGGYDGMWKCKRKENKEGRGKS
ncbi:hypothetical protein Tco_0150818 [Tanacetum coccineum]